ncbi:MAG: NAD-dependent protein deacetylase [Actinobacteria bacterium]|nr:NAD-dependent protein deacetylase [Actinomycetota bacterium]MBW3646498.1 NAD-dependent protein deacetylase [Actinomycetota bacterium]
MVLSGAGLSTDSGIPDYRGPTGALRRATPMTYQRFVGDPAQRQRYWARSHLGWRIVAQAAPNAGHFAVTALQEHGLLAGLVTQNVDGLHTRAGATGVIELHGNLHRVVCLGCGAVSARTELDDRLRAANAGWSASVGRFNPDGDVELPDDAVRGFTVVDCRLCGGLLKPDVVFFGETVPAGRVEVSFALVAHARLLLVLGSSLSVMSGYRFVLRAAKLGVPVAIVNQGLSRGDPHAALTLDAPLGEALPELVYAATGRTSPRRSLTRSPVRPARTALRPGPKT